jgi:hypothetical protein
MKTPLSGKSGWGSFFNDLVLHMVNVDGLDFLEMNIDIFVFLIEIK